MQAIEVLFLKVLAPAGMVYLFTSAYVPALRDLYAFVAAALDAAK